VRAQNGTITTFDVPGSFSTFATNINDEGAITGYYLATITHGYVRDAEGIFTTCDAPGAIGTFAFSVNAGGAVTGNYVESNSAPPHGFVRRADGTLISFDPPGSIDTRPVGINANGEITGFYQDANGGVHGFVREPTGTIISFDPPESTGTTAVSINDAGVITGLYTKANGRNFALCAIQMGNSPRSTQVLTRNRRVSTTKERLLAPTKTLTRFTRTALCARRTERLPYSMTRRFAPASPQASTTTV
jgi:hypothetical protein